MLAVPLVENCTVYCIAPYTPVVRTTNGIDTNNSLVAKSVQRHPFNKLSTLEGDLNSLFLGDKFSIAYTFCVLEGFNLEVTNLNGS